MERGWLAYDALVLAQEANARKEPLEHYRNLFRMFFDGFGDKDPDDSIDAGD